MSQVHSYHATPKKILLPIDFSPSTQPALNTAADLAKHFHASLHLMHVLSVFPTTTYPDFVPEQVVLQKANAYAESRLAKCVKALEAKDIKATLSVEVANDIPTTILEVIEREHIDLLVISTHGISGWHPMIFGSIAEKVIKVAECPLLLLRSPKPEVGPMVPARRSMEWW